MLGDSLVSYDGKVRGSYEVIKLGLYDGKVIGTILGNADIITLGIDVGTELRSSDGSFDVSNDGKIEGLLIGGLIGCNGGKVLGSNEGIKLGSTDGKLLGNIIGNVNRITIGIDVITYLGSLDGY